LSGNPAQPKELGKFRFELLWHAAVKARMANNSVFENFCVRGSYGLGLI
jgi:hypothetical protein